jgi:hypothetical protein
VKKQKGWIIYMVGCFIFQKITDGKTFDDDFIRSDSLGKESLRWYRQTINKEEIKKDKKLKIKSASTNTQWVGAVYIFELRQDKNFF